MNEPVSRILPLLTTDSSTPHASNTAHGFSNQKDNVYQKTLGQSVTVRGVSPTTGNPITMVLRPTSINQGIFFKRIDLSLESIYRVNLSTTQASLSEINLIQGPIRIQGIEHLISVLFGLGIDNVQIDLYQEEIPAMDESVEPLTFLIQAVGLLTQTAFKQFLRIKQVVRVTHLNTWAEIHPSKKSSFDINSTLFHPSYMTHEQHYTLSLTPSRYRRSLSRARHHAHSLAASKHRYPDEEIRHHLVDIIGDFSLLNRTIMGQFKSHNTNHLLNYCLLKQLVASKTAWDVVENFSHTKPSSETIYY